MLTALLAAILLVLSACTDGPEKRDGAQEVAEQFASAINDGDFEKAGSLTTSPDDATAAINSVVKVLQDPTITYNAGDVTASSAEAHGTYDVSWEVLGEPLTFTIDTLLVTDDENDWKVQWSTGLIHPDLAANQHVEIVQNDGNTPTVLDRNGQPVLSEQLVTVINIDPAEVTDADEVATSLASALKDVVGSITAESLTKEIDAADDVFTVVALRSEDAEKVDIPDSPGVVHNQQKRLLTTSKSLKSPVLAGLNEVWDEAAKASTGWQLQIQDQQHDVVKTLLERKAAPIDTISTTFDSGIQASAQQAVDALDEQVAVVAIQPSTGGILAVAQNQAADAEGPIALTGQYPPGSSFKIISTAAALDADAATPDTVLPCPGEATINGRTIPNDDEFDLGEVPLHTAFAQSCNTTIAALTADLPADSLHETALQFGLGVDYVAPGMTTITGSVPTSDSDAEQVENSIGQGKVVATPFGMALAAATVQNGSTPLPILMPGEDTTADQEPAAPSADTISALQAMMTEAVDSGTATEVADITGIAGKTGTAEFGDSDNAHGWFVGYYKDMAFAVLIVGAESSGPAVTLAGDFIRPIADQIPN